MSKRTFIIDPSLTFDPAAEPNEEAPQPQVSTGGCCGPAGAAQPTNEGGCCSPKAEPQTTAPRKSGCC